MTLKWRLLYLLFAAVQIMHIYEFCFKMYHQTAHSTWFSLGVILKIFNNPKEDGESHSSHKQLCEGDSRGSWATEDVPAGAVWGQGRRWMEHWAFVQRLLVWLPGVQLCPGRGGTARKDGAPLQGRPGWAPAAPTEGSRGLDSQSGGGTGWSKRRNGFCPSFSAKLATLVSKLLK